MIEIGTRVRITSEYGADDGLIGKEGTVRFTPALGNSLYQVDVDGESGWDAFFAEEMEIVK